MQTETIELYFQQGSSDKVYHLQLESVEEQWSVNAQWGRRGSALQSDTKVSSVAYAEAKLLYDRIIREKTGKGSFIVGPKPAPKAADGHRSIGLYLLEETRQRFMGTVGVPDRYSLPRDGQVVEIRYLYCHPGADGKLIQAKYFGQIRDDVARGDCSVNQLKLKADESDPTES